MSAIERPVILHLTSLISGGAGMFTLDFHNSILAKGYKSYVAYRGKEIIYPDGNRHVINVGKRFVWNKFRRWLFRLVVRFCQIDEAYSMYNLCERFTCYSIEDMLAAMPQKPDIVFVHWVSDYANAQYLNRLKAITDAKIVFILVDHALYSGGCHYQIECKGYLDGCHNCPATTSFPIKMAVEMNYAFKKKYLPESIIAVGTKSDRIRVSQSELLSKFRVEWLVSPLDEKKFRPSHDRTAKRIQWNIPIDKKIVFFGATSLNERRKGIKELLEALPKITTENVLFIAAGKVVDLQFPPNTIKVGYLCEDDLISMYQIADVFVCPSLADGGPMMVNQALMCGTPVVAFPVGASLELIQTRFTGYLAKYGDSDDLAKGIDHVLSLSQKEWQQVSDNCRKIAVDTYANPNNKGTIDDFMSKIYP